MDNRINYIFGESWILRRLFITHLVAPHSVISRGNLWCDANTIYLMQLQRKMYQRFLSGREIPLVQELDKQFQQRLMPR